MKCLNKIFEEIYSMRELVEKKLDENFMRIFLEIREVLLCILEKKSVKMENYPNFFSAFGRTQQYISFVKK